MPKPVRMAAARKARARRSGVRTTTLLYYYAHLDILRSAAAAVLAAEKRKLPRLRFASVSPSVRPSVIGFHRRRRRRRLEHELVLLLFSQLELCILCQEFIKFYLVRFPPV